MEGIAIKESEGQIDVTLWANKPVVLTVFPLATAQTVTSKEKKTAEAGAESAAVETPATPTNQDERAYQWLPPLKRRTPKKAHRTKRLVVLTRAQVEAVAKAMGVFAVPYLMQSYKGNKTKRAYHRMSCQVCSMARDGLVKKTGRMVRPAGSKHSCVEYAWIGS